MLGEEGRDKVAAFLAWFEAQGGSLCPSLQYAQDPAMGLSLFALADMAPDTEAICVPRKCCITAPVACRRMHALVGRPEGDDAGALTGKEWVVLYLFLHRFAEEMPPVPPASEEGQPSRMIHGLKSFDLDECLCHKAYVRLLPEETLTPLHYNKSEVALLQSTPLFGHAIECRRNGRKSCVKAVKWVLSSLKGCDGEWAQTLSKSLRIPPRLLAKVEQDMQIDQVREMDEWGDDEESWSVLKDWRWAETAYGSRAFPPRLLGEEEAGAEMGAPILIPGLDSFNHSRQAKVTWTWHASPREDITLTLHQRTSKGEQVFNSYGPKSNEDLLASYAFVNEGMEDDAVTLKLGGSGGSGQQHYWRLDEPCPEALLQEVRSALKQGAAQESQSNAEEKLMEEGEAMDVIIDMLEQKSEAFHSTQQLVDEVRQQEETIRESVLRNVVVYRQSQARILAAALRRAQKQLDAIEEALEGGAPQ